MKLPWMGSVKHAKEWPLLSVLGEVDQGNRNRDSYVTDSMPDFVPNKDEDQSRPYGNVMLGHHDNGQHSLRLGAAVLKVPRPVYHCRVPTLSMA